MHGQSFLRCWSRDLAGRRSGRMDGACSVAALDAAYVLAVTAELAVVVLELYQLLNGSFGGPFGGPFGGSLGGLLDDSWNGLRRN